MKGFYGNILVNCMGYAQGGQNGTGLQTGAEMAAAKNNMYGLLKLVQFNVLDDRLIASTEKANTFEHVGLVVLDVVEAQAYLETRRTGAGADLF
ncbi:hypothetical protein N7447_001779 [Penicillium robsamsonii]|uniref:uncharacterized protein n=1 Tax=Penicillium robsamsonii TaxID=1792511 RepID=UPI002549000B|nr:uncharacterized protein N7447_001779 [Penicillium robsamsonii]KAJ5835753.1 hypothetical protein N7447_001779 [Penicillium robsamsonii]